MEQGCDYAPCFLPCPCAIACKPLLIRTLSIGCPDRSTAETLVRVISVDKELRPHDVTKTFAVNDAPHGAELQVTVQATTLRHLRLAVNAFLEDSALIVRTIDAFGGEGALDAGAGGLEQGSTGRAG